MPILLSDEELDLLYEEHEFYFKLYVSAIRRYMDYTTGIVGIKRRISYQSMRETMYVQTRKGLDKEKCEPPTKSRLQRALKHLEKIGLIEQIKSKDNLIFRCLLAKRDYSVQNKPDTNPIHLNDTIPDTQDVAEIPYDTGLKEYLKSKPDTIPDTPENAIPDTPPVSGKAKEKETLRVSKKKTQIPDDFCVTDHHRNLANQNHWPDPNNEIDAFKDWHLSRGTTMADWDRAFYTWLRNAKRFKGGIQSANSQSTGKPNSFNRAVENIINSSIRSR